MLGSYELVFHCRDLKEIDIGAFLRESDLEVWYIALAHRQACCFADCSEREREREREREILRFGISLWHIDKHGVLLTA